MEKVGEVPECVLTLTTADMIFLIGFCFAIRIFKGVEASKRGVDLSQAVWQNIP